MDVLFALAQAELPAEPEAEEASELPAQAPPSELSARAETSVEDVPGATRNGYQGFTYWDSRTEQGSTVHRDYIPLCLTKHQSESLGFV